MKSITNGSATLALAIVCGSITVSARAEDVSAILLQKTQEFSDAGQQGQAAVMDRMLDPDVVFVNETGEPAAKADMVSGAAPPPKGVDIKMTVTDWHCQVFGDVAVARFIDDQAVDDHGQTRHARFRSVETWRKSAGDWRMIGSETLTLPEDPAPVTLSARALDDYVGAYEAGPGLKFTFTRSGDDLVASVNGGAPSVQKAEARDIFFTPGRGVVRKVFQRGADGKVTGFVYIRANGDLTFRRT